MVQHGPEHGRPWLSMVEKNVISTAVVDHGPAWSWTRLTMVVHGRKNMTYTTVIVHGAWIQINV